MVRSIFIFSLLFSSIAAYSQDAENSPIRAGLLRAQGTIAFGTFTDIENNPIYLHGNLEYYLKPTLSVRGDSYFFLKPNIESLFKQNHQLYIGPSMHIKTGGNFSPYVGIQGGVALSEYETETLTPNIQSSSSLNPIFSGVLGFNYYAANWFHLFMDARYVLGEHKSDRFNTSINEFRFSFGLGFNINTK